MHFQFMQEFDVSPQEYWTLFFQPEYNQELYKRLQMKTHKLVEQKEEQNGNIIRRTQLLEPTSALPSWAQAVLPSLAYTEYDIYHKARSVMEVRIEPMHMKEKFHLAGTYTVSAVGNGVCKREFQGDVKISIPLLGGKLEKLFMEQFAASEKITVQVTKDWIHNHPSPIK